LIEARGLGALALVFALVFALGFVVLAVFALVEAAAEVDLVEVAGFAAVDLEVVVDLVWGLAAV
jgi:hypothetical protein